MAKTLRDRVLEAAVDHIAEHGPDGLSLRQIAADAGVSHQAPYHHFGDRNAVFTAIAIEGFQKFTAEMVAPPRKGEDGDSAVRLCERYVAFALANTGHFRVMFRSDLCGMSDSEELQTVADAAFQTLVDVVDSIVDGKGTVDDVRILATTVWSVAHGLASLLIDGPLEGKIGKIADRRALVRSVARRARAGF